jgi:hypothetical protein
MSSAGSPVDPSILRQLTDLRSSSPNILFFISRSKNLNIVVYEANIKNGQLDPKEPVLVYWLDIDPEYVKKNRAKGITSDRSELNTIEKQFAYGLSSEALGNGKYKISLVAFKERPVHVEFDSASNHVICRMEINGNLVDLYRVYINATDRMIGLPKVNYVELTGADQSGNAVQEKIIAK